MGKELPNVAFRRSKPDPQALQAFIDSGTVAEPVAAVPAPAPLSLVRPVEESPVEEAVVEAEPAPDAAAAAEAVEAGEEEVKPVVEAAKPKATAVRNVATRAPSTLAKKGNATKRQILQRADGRELRKRTVYFSASTSLTLDIVCAQQQRDLSEVVQEALTMWLAKNT